MTIADVCENGILSERKIRAKLQITANIYFEFSILRKAIPICWLAQINNVSVDLNYLNPRYQTIKTIKYKEIHNRAIMNKKVKVKSKGYWEAKLENIEINWETIFIDI